MTARPSETASGLETLTRGRSWHDLPVLVALAAIVLAALWAGVLAQDDPPTASSPDAGFAWDMTTHHAQAVEMAELERDRTTDPELRVVATDVASTQQAQIGQFRGWLETWDLPATRRGPQMGWTGHSMRGRMPGMASRSEIARLQASSGEAADTLFLTLMIRHHQGGVAMAQAAADLATQPEVRRLARGIVAAQRSEIATMTDQLRRRGQPIPSALRVTTHTSEHEHEADLSTTLRHTGRYLPLAFGLLALGWLGGTLIRRPKARPLANRPAIDTLTGVAVAGSAVAGAFHLGLAPEHFDEATSYGIFFVVMGVAQLVAAGVLWASHTRRAAHAVAALNVILIGVYILFRIVAPPGADNPESVDLIGVVTVLAELTAASCTIAFLRASTGYGATHQADVSADRDADVPADNLDDRLTSDRTEDPGDDDDRYDDEDDIGELARRGPTRWQIVSLVVALCFLSGVVGWWIAQPGDESLNDVDVGFLADMTTHHQGAISTSFDYLGRENDSLVGHFAREIILVQSQQIAIMNGLLSKAGDTRMINDDVAMDWMGMPVPPAEMPGMANQAEMAELRASQDVAADEQFTRLMIRHHAAGATMADYAADHGENAKVKRLAANMAHVQRMEINEMNNRRATLGLTAVDTAEFEQQHGSHR